MYFPLLSVFVRLLSKFERHIRRHKVYFYYIDLFCLPYFTSIRPLILLVLGNLLSVAFHFQRPIFPRLSRRSAALIFLLLLVFSFPNRQACYDGCVHFGNA